MTFEALECFVEIARGATYMEAAEEFHLSQSALSKMIKKMENELGVQLFDRSGRSVKLTKAGKQLLADYDAMEPSYQAMKLDMRQMAERETLKVVVGIPGGEFHIHNILDHFCAENPRIPVDVDQPRTDRIEHASEAVRNGTADLIILHQTADCQDKSFEILVSDDPLMVVLPEGHRLSARKKISLGDLKEETLILDNWSAEILQSLNKEQKIHFSHIREVKQKREDILWDITTGAGITILRQSDLKSLNMDRTVVKKVSGLKACPLIMVTAGHGQDSAPLKTLKAYLLDALKEEK